MNISGASFVCLERANERCASFFPVILIAFRFLLVNRLFHHYNKMQETKEAENVMLVFLFLRMGIAKACE